MVILNQKNAVLLNNVFKNCIPGAGSYFTFFFAARRAMNSFLADAPAVTTKANQSASRRLVFLQYTQTELRTLLIAVHHRR